MTMTSPLFRQGWFFIDYSLLFHWIKFKATLN